MATYTEMYNRSKDGRIMAQIAMAITKDAKYNLEVQPDPDTTAWAMWVVPHAESEARNWQMVVCLDPAVADATVVLDQNVQDAVTPLIPSMVASYKAKQPAA